MYTLTQSHAAIRPSATAFTFCHYSRGMAPRHYGYFPALSTFRREIKGVRGWESESPRNSKGERDREWRTWELTEGVTDALDQKRQVEHVIGGSQAPSHQHCSEQPPLETAGLPWILGEVTTEEEGSQAYLWKIISFDTVVLAHTQHYSYLSACQQSHTQYGWWIIWEKNISIRYLMIFFMVAFVCSFMYLFICII